MLASLEGMYSRQAGEAKQPEALITQTKEHGEHPHDTSLGIDRHIRFRPALDTEPSLAGNEKASYVEV